MVYIQLSKDIDDEAMLGSKVVIKHSFLDLMLTNILFADIPWLSCYLRQWLVQQP